MFMLRAAAIQPFVRVPQERAVDVGTSYVYLDQPRRGARQCEALGAGYWLGTEIEDHSQLGEAAVPHPGRGGFRNPTAARANRPLPQDRGPQDWSDYSPAIAADGPVGQRWTASCNSAKTAGQGTGIVTDLPGVQTAGSTVTAGAKDAGYAGTGRAYLQDVATATATVRSLYSLMQVSLPVEGPARVTYRLTVAVIGAAGTMVGADEHQIVLGGTSVPVGELVAQFNEQASSQAAGLAVLGPLGLRVLAPTVTIDERSGITSITSPILETNAGLAAKDRGYGHDQGLRLAAITLTSDRA